LKKRTKTISIDIHPRKTEEEKRKTRVSVIEKTCQTLIAKEATAGGENFLEIIASPGDTGLFLEVIASSPDTPDFLEPRCRAQYSETIHSET